jgi:DNA-binding NarL/FixJ family response regulator
MDITMPHMNGVEATKIALQHHPNLKVLALSGFDDAKYYFSMIEAGAKGYVLKNSGIAELKNAIIEVSQNRSWFSHELLQNVIHQMDPKTKKNPDVNLSGREIEVLQLICKSLTNEQIAEKLSLSYETIRWHRANILSKTGSTNTAGLVIYAIKNKLIVV